MRHDFKGAAQIQKMVRGEIQKKTKPEAGGSLGTQQTQEI